MVELKRRSREEICMDMLKLLLYNRLSMKYTKFMFKSNSNYKAMKEIYLPYLTKKRWITKNLSGKCEITNEGITKYINFRIGKAIQNIDLE
jgi:predicted transcriptional regulator